MIAYKLLSRYPGIPRTAQVGDYLTFDLTTQSYTNRFQNTSYFNGGRDLYYISQKYVEGYTDFFKKCEIQIKVEEV